MANLYYISAQVKIEAPGPAGTTYDWEDWTSPAATEMAGPFNLASHAVAESGWLPYAELPYTQISIKFRVGKDPDNAPITEDVYFRYASTGTIWYAVHTIDTDEFVEYHVAQLPTYEKLVGAGDPDEDGYITAYVSIPAMSDSLGANEYYKSVQFEWAQSTITVSYEDAETDRYYITGQVKLVPEEGDISGLFWSWIPGPSGNIDPYRDSLPYYMLGVDYTPTHGPYGSFWETWCGWLYYAVLVQDNEADPGEENITDDCGFALNIYGSIEIYYSPTGFAPATGNISVDITRAIIHDPGDLSNYDSETGYVRAWVPITYTLPDGMLPVGWGITYPQNVSLLIQNPRIQDPNYSIHVDSSTPTLSQSVEIPLPYYQESSTEIRIEEGILILNDSYKIAAVWKRAHGDTNWILYRLFDKTLALTYDVIYYAPLPYGGGSEYWLDVDYNIMAYYSGRKVIVDNRAIWNGSEYVGGQVVEGEASGTDEVLDGDPAGYDPTTDTDPATSTRPGAYSKTFSSPVPFYTHTYTTYFDWTSGGEKTTHELSGPHYTDTVGGIPDPGTTTTVTIIPAPPGTTVTEDPATGLPVVTVTQPPIPYPEDTGDSGEKEVIDPKDGSVKDPGVVTPVTESVSLTAADYIQGIPGYPTNYFVSVGGTDVVAFAYNVTESQILSRVFRILGVTQEGQQPSAAQISCAREALGALIRSFQDRGVHFWTTAWMYVALSTTPSSVLGTDGKYYRCINSHISDSDNKPITGKNWTSYWLETTTATTTVWATSTTYYSNNMVLDPTLDDLEQAFLRDANGYDTTLELVDAKAWGELSNKNEIGRPTKIWLNRTLTRTIQLWPIPDLTTYVLHYRRIRYLNDFTAVTGTGDFPQSWIDAIIFHLAHRLSFEYGNPIQEREELKMTALELEAVARGYNHERPTSNRLASCY